MRKGRLAAIIAVVLVLALVSGIAVQAEPAGAIGWKVLSGGGGVRSATAQQLSDTTGQTAAGVSQSTQYRLQSGFWAARPASGPAPTVTSLSPLYGFIGNQVNVTINGADFQAGVTVKLSLTGQPDIAATNISLINEIQLTCTFNLTGAHWGSYDVVLTNPGGLPGISPAGFIVRTLPASITGIVPAYGVTNTTVSVAINGSGFIAESSVKLQRTGQADITATNVTINPTSVTCKFDLTGAALGNWDVMVKNPDNQTASVAEAFTVTLPVTEITIGQGTSSTTFPMGAAAQDQRTQVIYLASEIGQAGAISALALNVATPPSATLNNWTIRMRHFSQSAESGIWITPMAWDTVYQGNEPAGTGGWRKFIFSQPFEYNGSQNLEIDFSFNNSAGSTSGACFYSVPTANSNRVLYGTSNSANGDPLNWTSTTPAGTKSDKVPNIRLTTGSTGGYDLTVNVSPSGSGIVNHMGGTFQAGTQLNLVAQANNGYMFDHWGGDAAGTNPNIIVTMNASKAVTAYFKSIQNTLTISSTDGGSVVTPGEGTYTYNYGQQVSLAAQPETGYRFVRWTGDVGTMADYIAASTTIGIGGNYSITAEFTRITYQLIINTRGEGNTTPEPGDHPYNQGSQVEIKAEPAEGYQFGGWSGDITGTLNPVSITMNGNKTVTAIFIKTAPMINEIKQDPTAYEGHSVEVSGEYRGWESGHGSPPVTRSDWVLKDITGVIYVTGTTTQLRHPQDIGKKIEINGIVHLKNGTPYILLSGVINNLAPNASFENGNDQPTGWVPQVNGTNATLEWSSGFSRSGKRSLMITASQPGQEGWPGWETTEAIPIDPTKRYEFKSYYLVDGKGLLWMDIELFDATGALYGTISTGTPSILPQTNTWLTASLSFDPTSVPAPPGVFPKIASVKLGLRLSLNYELAGIPAGTVTKIYFDDVSFNETSISYPPTATPTTPAPTQS